MRYLFLLALLLTLALAGQEAPPAGEESPVAVLGFKWAKTRQTVGTTRETAASVSPAPTMTPAVRNPHRNVRPDDPLGTRDPNAGTTDARAAAIEKNVQESRKAPPKQIEGFAYKVKVQNAGQKVAEIVFFEYQFTETAAPANTTRRQFLCGVNIKPGKEKELLAFSLSGPSDVISVGSLSARDAALFQEKVLINRVEYSDGSIWQRKGWDFAEIKAAYNRAVGTPWDPAEMCRGL
jgi:hypothetical protein